jgi:hypothetical protein
MINCGFFAQHEWYDCMLFTGVYCVGHTTETDWSLEL